MGWSDPSDVRLHLSLHFCGCIWLYLTSFIVTWPLTRGGFSRKMQGITIGRGGSGPRGRRFKSYHPDLM